MKKILLSAMLVAVVTIAQATIVSRPGSNYYFEHQAIPAGADMKAAYGEGVQMIASYKPNSIVVVWLEDTGKAFLLSSKVAAKSSEFSLVPQRDIQLYAIDKKGRRKPVKQYKKDKIQKAFEAEVASEMKTYQPVQFPTKLVVNYQGSYGQNLGRATITQQNSNPFDAVTGAILNPMNANRQARLAGAPYAQQYANLFWDRHTFFPGDEGEGKTLFEDKKAPSYELVIQLGNDKHIFHFDRLKK